MNICKNCAYYRNIKLNYGICGKLNVVEEKDIVNDNVSIEGYKSEKMKVVPRLIVMQSYGCILFKQMPSIEWQIAHPWRQ